MVIKGSAAKRHRQARKRRMRNRVSRSRVRTEIRKFLSAVENKNKAEAEDRFRTAAKLVDTAAGKGVYHKNTAARTKSRLQKKLNEL
ncbi:MAG: 30S ribosomal protein S20 [Spirochaetaceae bacterium]